MKYKPANQQAAEAQYKLENSIRNWKQNDNKINSIVKVDLSLFLLAKAEL